MARNNSAKFYHYGQTVSLTKEAVLYPSKGRRSYFLLENRSGATVYLNFDMSANINDGVQILAGGVYELEQTAPDNTIHISGSLSSGQRVNITEAFDA